MNPRMVQFLPPVFQFRSHSIQIQDVQIYGPMLFASGLFYFECEVILFPITVFVFLFQRACWGNQQAPLGCDQDQFMSNTMHYLLSMYT